jgi:probable F420-dependent oxidoreductase
MKLGYFGFNMGVLGSPEAIERVARAAEGAGLESLFSGEHVVVQDPQAPPSPLAPETPVVDQIATLAYAAAITKRIKLGTGIIILPQRNPVVLAKELASLDVLSRGRLLVGFGVGYVEREFEAIGVPFAERGPRTSEHIEAIRALWTQAKPRFEGRFTKFSGIQSHPRPVQQPHPPILVGGMSKSALKRAVAHGNEWYGFYQSVDATAAAVRGLEEAAKAVPRPAALGKLGLTVTPPPGAIDRDTLRRYEDLGVSRLVLMRDFADMQRLAATKPAELDEVVRFIETSARALG